MFSSDKSNNGPAQKLVHHFFNSSLNFSLQPQEVESLTWDEQQTFLNATVNNKIVKKYPVSLEFCRLYIKKIIECLEPAQEVHDDIYSFLCSILNSNTQQKFCYRHYIIGNNIENIITIKETKNMVVNGTTGMRTWQAAIMLADYAMSNKDKFRGKTILELGSGVGFTGIAIAKYCETNLMLLSDCHDEVLQMISENIQINFPKSNPERDNNGIATLYKNNTKSIGYMMLDWNCIEDLPDNIVPDVVIGADIIYDPSIIKPLCEVITQFYNRNKTLEVYIANIIRNEETYEIFLNILDNMNLAIEEVPHAECVYVDWDCNIKKCFLKIKLNK